MTTPRFARLFSRDPVDDPGVRLRLEWIPDCGAVLVYEKVLPEQAGNPDARHVAGSTTIELTTTEARWLATHIAELATEMERRDAEAQAWIDARKARK